MKKRNNIKILIFILIAIITVAVGYASISAMNLFINGNITANVDNNNYNVVFLDDPGITPTIEGAPTNSVALLSDTSASFNVTTLEKKGDSVTATLKVKNLSKGIGTSISIEIINNNTSYYKVTETIADSKLQAGEETTITVRVDMINTPFENDVSANIITNLVASPIDDDSASVTNPITEDFNKDYLYTTKVLDVSLTGDIRSIPYIYDNSQDAIHDLSSSVIVYKRFLMNGNTIEKKYIAQEVNGITVYIQYGVDESNVGTPLIFNRNVEMLQTAYGNGNCTLTSDTITCHKNAFYAEVRKNGNAQIQENNVGCDMNVCGTNFPT